jgi:hypothetical protein
LHDPQRETLATTGNRLEQQRLSHRASARSSQKPYLAGSFPMRAAAIITGTKSRVSPGS